MKTLGKSVRDGEIRDEEDIKYHGGSIVMLTEEESTLLAKLEAAWEGEGYMFTSVYERKTINTDMSAAFKAICYFVETKFAVNEFQSAIDRLQEILTSNEKS